jgi:NAD(P)H dehydrogenase (quinone)
MQDVNVVVVFHSRSGSTEQLALAAAVGAVQGRANIRLRRLPDVADEAAIAGDPQWKEHHERMNREYVAPRETDAAWADAIVIGIAAGAGDIAPAFGSYAGKIGAVFADGSGSHALRAAMDRAGLIVLPDEHGSDAITAARLLGRRVAEAARREKKMRPAG